MILIAEKNSANDDLHFSSEGSLNGVFSVSPTKRVYFSQGNLRYIANSNSWLFAEKQYYHRGYPYPTSDDRPQTSFSFMSGSLYGKSNIDYDKVKFVDWGCNPIKNGGNIPHRWRTLTIEEWKYLFCGRANAAAKYAHISLTWGNRRSGMLLLPDNWLLPDGVQFEPGIKKGSLDNYQGIDLGWFSSNFFNYSDWVKMEMAGAVFLPTEVGVNYSSCVYWSSTQCDEYNQYCIHIGPQYIRLETGGKMSTNFVRLVRDV